MRLVREYIGQVRCGATTFGSGWRILASLAALVAVTFGTTPVVLILAPMSFLADFMNFLFGRLKTDVAAADDQSP